MAKGASAASKSSPMNATNSDLPKSTSLNGSGTGASSLRQTVLDAPKSNAQYRPATAGDAITSRYANANLWADCYAMDSPTMDITTAEKDTFHFPTPIRRPMTANSSPRLIQSRLSPVDSGIGMSMSSLNQRSPFMSPLSSQYASTPMTMDSVPPIRSNTTREFKNEGMEGARPKLSRWRSLGGIFGRKKSVTKPVSKNFTDLQRDAAAFDLAMKMPTAQGQQSPGLFRRVTKRGVRSRGLSNKSREAMDQRMASLEAPHLNIEIPEAEMERYSVLFNKVNTLPNRSPRLDSLLARRQAAGDGTWPHLGSNLKACSPELTTWNSTDCINSQPIDVPTPGRARRGTEPSPRQSPAYGLSANDTEDASSDDLPHISALLTRPRPIRRHNTAPSMLSVPIPQDQQLSPTFEADEMDPNDQGSTPTPSSPASPSTPTYLPPAPVWTGQNASVKSLRKNSWDNDSARSLNGPWEFITVSKRLSPGDLSTKFVKPATPEPTVRQSIDWVVEERPQVSIARSLSVTKAGKRSNLKPTRVNSRRNAGTSTKYGPKLEKLKTSNSLPPPVPAKDTTKGEANASTKQVASPSLVVVRTGSRREDLQRDLTREIWGEHGLSGVGSQVRENRALTPNLCVVEEVETRKSVYAVMESVDAF